MTRNELRRRLAAAEARAQKLPATAEPGLDYSMMDLNELLDLERWTIACGDRPMLEWARTLAEAERERFRDVFAKLVKGQPRAA